MSGTGMFGVGYNGHAKSCDCRDCARARAERTSQLWEANGSYARPKSGEATIFVRSYFRKQAGHLNKYPNTQRLMRELVKGIKKLKSEE